MLIGFIFITTLLLMATISYYDNSGIILLMWFISMGVLFADIIGHFSDQSDTLIVWLMTVITIIITTITSILKCKKKKHRPKIRKLGNM